MSVVYIRRAVLVVNKDRRRGNCLSSVVIGAMDALGPSKMWIATIEFMKAVDSTNHNSRWGALKTCGIEHEYISVLKRLHKKATVMTDKESDMFEINKGTKQGDPLSSLLFYSVLQVALKDDLPCRQKKKGMGTC